MKASQGKFVGILAALCLLCCMVPVVALLAGGAGLAAVSLAMGKELAIVAAIAGFTAMAISVGLLWRRWQAPRCDTE